MTATRYTSDNYMKEDFPEMFDTQQPVRTLDREALDICNLYRQGWTIPVLAEHYDMSKGTVRMILDSHNVEVRRGRPTDAQYGIMPTA